MLLNLCSIFHNMPFISFFIFSSKNTDFFTNHPTLPPPAWICKQHNPPEYWCQTGWCHMPEVQSYNTLQSWHHEAQSSRLWPSTITHVNITHSAVCDWLQWTRVRHVTGSWASPITCYCTKCSQFYQALFLIQCDWVLLCFTEWDSSSLIKVFYASKGCLYFTKTHQACHVFEVILCSCYW